MRTASLSLAAILVLGACASTADPENGYAARERRLADDCQARGGILAPTGQMTGRPETENVCRISNVPGRAGSAN